MALVPPWETLPPQQDPSEPALSLSLPFFSCWRAGIQTRHKTGCPGPLECLPVPLHLLTPTALLSLLLPWQGTYPPVHCRHGPQLGKHISEEITGIRRNKSGVSEHIPLEDALPHSPIHRPAGAEEHGGAGVVLLGMGTPPAPRVPTGLWARTFPPIPAVPNLSSHTGLAPRWSKPRVPSHRCLPASHVGFGSRSRARGARLSQSYS